MPNKRVTKKSPARKKAKPTARRSTPTVKAAKKPAKKSNPKAARPARSGAARPGSSRSGPTRSASQLASLEHLIGLMVERDVVEVEIEEAGARWRVRRAEPQTVTYAAPAGMPMSVAPMVAHGAAPVAPAPAAAVPAEPQGEVFKSPMVGTFYRAASPDAEPFCKPGDMITSDRTLCIIEAMKVMNEIKPEQEQEFEVVDVLVKNGESVEFGQPLFLVR